MIAEGVPEGSGGDVYYRCGTTDEREAALF